MQRKSCPSANREPERRNHHRLGRKLYSLSHALKLSDSEIHIIPFFFLHRHEQQHQICADRKVLRIVGDHECVEVVARPGRLECLSDQRNDVAAQRIHLGVKLDTRHAIPNIDQRRPGVFLHNSVRLLSHRDRPDTSGNFDRLVV